MNAQETEAGTPARPRVALLEARRTDELGILLRQKGLEPYHAPALREEPAPDDPAISAFVDRLAAGSIDLVVLVTGVGTTALLDAARRMNVFERLVAGLERVTVLARGPKPVAALRAVGLRPDIVAPSPHTTPEVLGALAGHDLQGRTVAVQLAGEPSIELRHGLEARGAHVDELTLYRWALPLDIGPVERLIGDLASGALDAVAVTSSPQVHNLFAIAERMGSAAHLRDSLARVVVASVGPAATRTLQSYGVSVDVEPDPPKMGPLAVALAAALSE